MDIRQNANIERLKERVFESDNTACFIERDRILQGLKDKWGDKSAANRCVEAFTALLSGVSTPVDENDIILGRVVETRPEPQSPTWWESDVFRAVGHMSYDYERLLKKGLSGILQEIEETAAKNGDAKSAEFADHARSTVRAIREYAARYAVAAKLHGKTAAAEAFERVPFEPAYDLYSALQSVWLIHMTASCYVGSRDYAFGRIDKYLYPYYKSELEKGTTHEEIIELLVGFFLKTNEVAGRTTHNFKSKPTPCQASKQYVVIGGTAPNELSVDIMKAAEILNMAEPVFTVALKADASERFTRQVFHTMHTIGDKMQVYNYDLIHECLLRKGLPEYIASDFTFSGCCTLDFHYHTGRNELYVPSVELFLETIGVIGETQTEYHSIDEIVDALYKRTKTYLQSYADRVAETNGTCGGYSALDAMLLGSCAKNCRYPIDNGMDYKLLNFFFCSIATIADSLSAIDRLVFKEKRFDYSSFINIVKNNFDGYEQLRMEILGFDKFGNDTETDKYCVLAANALIDASDDLTLPDGYYAVGGFYTLERDHTFGVKLPATPDGRLSGTPASENQSPVYGCDKNGITSLLKSVAKLPFARTPNGGLNIFFSGDISADLLQSLILSYFKMGGLHVGITLANKKTLEDAMVNPDRYKSLTVRLYGFSEYFISLPEWQQTALLNRTAY
jgi:formate C-acetyltransferase